MSLQAVASPRERLPSSTIVRTAGPSAICAARSSTGARVSSGTERESTVERVSELLPLFPLSSVLFPGALMPLHIFESRYRLLIRRCIERRQSFGIVLIRSGSEVGASAEPHAIGTEARIVAESPLVDGRSYIVTRGHRRFAVERIVADAEPYLVGHVRYLDEPDGVGAADHASQAREALGEPDVRGARFADRASKASERKEHGERSHAAPFLGFTRAVLRRAPERYTLKPGATWN